MAMSAYAAQQSLTYYLTTSSAAARPTSWQVSLHTGDPGTAGTANEVTDSAYARQAISFTIDTTTPSAPFAKNSALVTYPAAATGFTATHAVIWSNAGNPLVIQRLATSKVVGVGVQAQFAAGEFVIGGIPQ